jgi:hypothetical protein
MTHHPAPNPLASFFGVALRGRTYLNIVYLWLAFPFGLLYFVALVTCLSLGVGLAIVWVGFAILFFTLLAVWAAGAFERSLAMGLLGASVPPRRAPGPAVETPGQWLRGVFAGPALWKSLGFLLLKFPLGLAGWIVSVTTLAVSGAFVLAPVVYALGGTVDLAFDIFLPRLLLRGTDDWIDAAILMVIGVFMLVATLHLHNALAFAWARLSESMLGGEPAARRAPREAQPASL